MTLKVKLVNEQHSGISYYLKTLSAMKHVVGEKCSVVQQENYYLFFITPNGSTHKIYKSVYTLNHKKRDILFLTITLANLNRFFNSFYTILTVKKLYMRL